MKKVTKNNNGDSCILTVVNKIDTFLLYLQAVSIIKFWGGEKKYTIIIEDALTEDSEVTSAFITEYIMPMFNDEWTINVLLGKTTSTDSGWHRQQLLKLHYSSIMSTDWVLLLDTKNIFIKHCDLSHFFRDDMPIMNMYPGSHEFGIECNRNMRKYLKLDDTSVTNNFSLLTPALFNTTLLRNMLIKINFDVNKWEFGVATEISLYLNYATQYQTYIQCETNVGIYDNDDTDVISRKDYAMTNDDVVLWSHHRRAYSVDTCEVSCSILKEAGFDESVIKEWLSMYDATVNMYPEVTNY